MAQVVATAGLTAGGVAAEVGDSYLSAKSTPRHPLVAAAYEHLQQETDRLFDALVNVPRPRAVRIVFTRGRNPYDSDAELIAAVRACRVLEVTTAAVSREPLHPLLGCDYGGPFDRFRAVHDLVGHAMTGFGFGLTDELGAWRVQDALHGPLARWALATEILAINCARSIVGEAPEQKAMLLGPRLVQRSRSVAAGGAATAGSAWR